MLCLDWSEFLYGWTFVSIIYNEYEVLHVPIPAGIGPNGVLVWAVGEWRYG